MKNKVKVTIPYKPRYPQNEIHPQLESHRFNVLVTHRQMGKTVCAINHILKMAIKNKRDKCRYFYVAPFRNQAKMIAWDYLKQFTRPISLATHPQTGQRLNSLKINEQELSVTVGDKFTVTICGADNPDALRGTYADGVVLDEYGDMKPNIFDEIIRPMLLSRKGWVEFVGTPKGQNQFYNIYLQAAAEYAKNPNGDWWAGMYRADQTGVIEEEELNKIAEQTPETTFRQEYLCDFAASAENVLIPIDNVISAQGRYYSQLELAGATRVIGVDVARFGDDKSVIFKRHGLQAYEPEIFSKLDNVDLAGHVARTVREFRADAVFVDAGNGAGVIDVLRKMNIPVIEVPFGSTPAKPGQYANKRAEMWGDMADWIRGGGALPKIDGLASDLTSAVYDFNQKGQIRLEPKERIKERLGKSPDLADALALTFAQPVFAKGAISHQGGKSESYEMEYDFLD